MSNYQDVLNKAQELYQVIDTLSNEYLALHREGASLILINAKLRIQKLLDVPLQLIPDAPAVITPFQPSPVPTVGDAGAAVIEQVAPPPLPVPEVVNNMDGAKPWPDPPSVKRSHKRKVS